MLFLSLLKFLKLQLSRIQRFPRINHNLNNHLNSKKLQSKLPNKVLSNLFRLPNLNNLLSKIHNRHLNKALSNLLEEEECFKISLLSLQNKKKIILRVCSVTHQVMRTNKLKQNLQLLEQILMIKVRLLQQVLELSQSHKQPKISQHLLEAQLRTKINKKQTCFKETNQNLLK